MDRICIAQPELGKTSETFLRAHADNLPGRVTVVHLTAGLPSIDGSPVLPQDVLMRGLRKARRFLAGRDYSWEFTAGLLAAFRQINPQVVLAEYGPTGVAVLDACEIAGIPMVVHFHGYDASQYKVLERYQEGYRRLFKKAAGIIAVSNPMLEKLLGMGAPPDRTHLNPCGVDCARFNAAHPGESPPLFLSTGRFVEKKAPQLTLLAFAEAFRLSPSIRLRMIGAGPLLDACKNLAVGLRVSEAVEFLGQQPHEVVCEQMQEARAFVQHSVQAPDGDCEGTPVAVLEAGASGLPVVATRHAGIPDVVIDEQTGLLCDETDVGAMANNIGHLARDPALAAQLGTAARKRILSDFSMEKSTSRLCSILRDALSNE